MRPFIPWQEYWTFAMTGIKGFSININPVFCPICKKEIGEVVNTRKFEAELKICSECNTERAFDACAS